MYLIGKEKFLKPIGQKLKRLVAMQFVVLHIQAKVNLVLERILPLQQISPMQKRLD
jgi:hypothetical protein